MSELWKDIDGYEGLYEVSSMGRVRSLARLNARGSKIRSRIMAINLNPNYGEHATINLTKNARQHGFSVSHLVMSAFLRNRTSKNEVAYHIDGDVSNNFAENLTWITRQVMSENNPGCFGNN